MTKSKRQNIRLNAFYRQSIKEAALKSLSAEVEIHKKKGEALYHKALKTIFPKKFIDALALVCKERPDLIETGKSSCLNVGGRNIQFYLEQKQVVFNSWTSNKPVVTDPDLIQEIWDWAVQLEEKETNVRQTSKTLEALLKTVASTDSLFEVWPEGEKFYSVPPLTPLDKPQLPALQVAELNKMLGIGV